MIKKLKYYLLVFFSVYFIANLTAQNLTIEETLKYINEKINSNKIPEDENAEYFWQVSDEGMLTITKYNQQTWNLSQSVYLKSLDTTSIILNNNNYMTDYYFTIDISCKYGQSNITKTYSRDLRISVICIRFLPDKELADRLKNAIIYLLRKAYENPNFKG